MGAGNISGSGGEPDILWQNTSTGEIGYWTLTSGQSSAATGRSKPPGIVSTAWHIAATPDINGDGQADIVFQNVSTGEVGYWLMQSGQRQSYTQISAPGVVSPTTWLLRGGFKACLPSVLVMDAKKVSKRIFSQAHLQQESPCRNAE